jgi:capsular exopolysaccharide synthesis family protein
MDLKFYLSTLWGSKWIIVISIIMALVVAVIGIILITPTFSATTTLRVATASIGSISYYDYISADRLMNTYTEIATSKPIMDELAERLNLDTLPGVEITPISYTELIKITINHNNPNIAQNAANTLAHILVEQSQELYTGGEKSAAEVLGEQLAIAEAELNQARNGYEGLLAESPDDAERIEKANLLVDLKTRTYETLLEQYEAARLRELLRANIITIVEPATLPEKPSRPNKVLILAMALIFGVVAGFGVVYIVEFLNPHIRSSDQVEEITGIGVIGKIPSIRYRGLIGLLKRNQKPNSLAFKEAFQKLQAKLNQQNTDDNSMKCILITSAVPGEGKSTLVTNLSIAISKSGKKTIAVDCDMRRPVLHVMNDLPNDFGLSTLLNRQITLAKAVQKTQYENNYILTSGPIVSNPMELLGSPVMEKLIVALTNKYDTVLLDAPAMLPVGDGLILASLASATLLVVRQDKSKEGTLREVFKQLSDLNSNLIGAVMNEARQNSTYYYYKK